MRHPNIRGDPATSPALTWGLNATRTSASMSLDAWALLRYVYVSYRNYEGTHLGESLEMVRGRRSDQQKSPPAECDAMTRKRAESASTATARMTHNPGRPRDQAVDDAILRATIELFVEHGVEGANIEQIARRSGVARATIYRRWPGREELLTDALLKVRRPPEQEPDTLAAMSPADSFNFLKSVLIEALMKPESPKLAARLIGAGPDHPALLAGYRRVFLDPWRLAVARSLRRATDAGAFPVGTDPGLVLDMLVGSVLHRLVMRTGLPVLAQESRWLDRAFRQLGFRPERLSGPERTHTRGRNTA